MSSALVLNTTYEPVSVVSARRAVVLVLNEKASVIAAGSDCLHSERRTIEIPSVVRLVKYVKVPHHRKAPPTRRAILARDKHTCQYCSHPPKASTMSCRAHVEERMIGRTLWQLAAAATFGRLIGCRMR